MTTETLFRETQRFRQWWLWLIVLFVAAVAWSGFLQQIVGGGTFGTDPASDTSIWLMFLFGGLALPLTFGLLKLETEVRPGAVSVQFPPFRRRTVDLDEVLEVQAIDYKPVAQYGGYGYRIRRGGVAYNVSGKRGVRLSLPEGRHLLIGSQRAEELAAAIESARQHA